MTQRTRAAVISVLIAMALIIAVPAFAGAADPTVIDPATGASTWTYQDLYDVSTKYEGGYAEFDNSGETTYSASPHGGYNTTTNKCKVCHAVHRAEGAYHLLRADSQDDACSYCHIGSAHSSKVVYDLNPDGIYTENGHTIGAQAQIPNSTTSQAAEAVTLTTTDADGNTVTETIYVRSYSDQKLEMYRFTRHHGQSAFGTGRDGYQKIGPVALTCMNCHQTHNATAQIWRPYAIDPVTSQTTTTRSSGYKLLKLFPSGSTTGTPNAYNSYEPGQVVAVPETTLTAGVNYSQTASAEDVSTDPAFPAGTYAQPLWIAQQIGPAAGQELGSRRDANTVNTAALSVWCADCHNLNIGGSTSLAPELGFKAHTERTHPAPYVGAFRGPGQCYSCHRNDLPRIATGDACSQCHYGTGNYAKNRQDPTHYEYVDSDFPHSGEAGDYKMLGSYSVDVAGLNPTTIDETVTVGPGNLDAVCLRCHWVPQQYHDTGETGASGHDVPAAYAACTVCHNAGGVTDIHATAPDGCYSCHDAPTLTSDCGTCHPDNSSRTDTRPPSTPQHRASATSRHSTAATTISPAVSESTPPAPPVTSSSSVRCTATSARRVTRRRTTHSPDRGPAAANRADATRRITTARTSVIGTPRTPTSATSVIRFHGTPARRTA
ncbi:MAG: hypothetical protein Q8K99_10540 [Actinomycetota bacterium]|nr:hypothetical protein [Actinomycetota bacterium]